MNQQPDKLFQEKLQGYQRPVRPEAWKRVSANLEGSKSGNFWLRIAAALIVLAVAAVFILTGENAHLPANIARKVEPVKKEHPENPETDQSRKEASSSKAETQITDINTIPRRKNARSPSRKQTLGSQQEPSLNQEADARAEISQTEKKEEQAAQELQPGQWTVQHEPVAQAEKVEARVKIVFTAEEVNEKYLDKKDLAEATPENKKSSSLRKLLDKAYDLKHNQDPLGELRQKKNEILAFNFKNERPQHE